MASSLQKEIREYLKPLCLSWTYIHEDGPKKGQKDTEYAIRVNTSGYRGTTVATAPAGWADINCILKSGVHVYIEVKKANETTRNAQKAYMKQLRERGIICFVARSMDDVEKNFKAFGLSPEQSIKKIS